MRLYPGSIGNPCGYTLKKLHAPKRRPCSKGNASGSVLSASLVASSNMAVQFTCCDKSDMVGANNGFSSAMRRHSTASKATHTSSIAHGMTHGSSHTANSQLVLCRSEQAHTNEQTSCLCSRTQRLCDITIAQTST
jgi:hypothetical protein